MSNIRIIYPNGNGGIAIIIPVNDSDIELILSKDVPAGLPYLIVSAEDIPSDRTFRDAWEADFSDPDGISGE